jgi:hypothetical protein
MSADEMRADAAERYRDRPPSWLRARRRDELRGRRW